MTLGDVRRVLDQLERELCDSRAVVLASDEADREDVADLLRQIENKLGEARSLLSLLERRFPT